MRTKIRFMLTIVILLALLMPFLGASAQTDEEPITSPRAEAQESSWVIWKQLCPLGADLKSVPLPGYPPVLVFCVLQGTDTWLWKDVCPMPITTVFEPGLGTHAVCEDGDAPEAKTSKVNTSELYEQLIE
jgi:hypothetical protein